MNKLLKKTWLFFKKFGLNDLTTLIFRLLILYIIIFTTQLLFYFYNKDILGEISLFDIGRLLKGSIVFDNISIFYANLLFIVLSTLPFRFRANIIYQKILFWIFLIINSLTIVILNIADIIYFHYASKRFTSEEFHFLKNSNNLPIIKEALFDNWWLILVTIALIFVLILSYKKIKYHPTTIKKLLIYYPINAVLFIVIIYLTISGIRGGFRIKQIPYSLNNAAFYTKNPQQANIILSNPFCVLRTLKVEPIQVPHYYSEKELNKLYTPYHYPSNFKFSFSKKPNVFIFILESFSKEHSKFYCPKLYANEDGYTPFLDSLMRESYVFTNAYSNGFKSNEAIPSIFSSIPSYKRAFILLPQSLGTTEGLPKILSNNGYSTYFFCGAESNSMGFESYAKVAGIKNIYSRNQYSSECEVNKYTVEPYWGVFDMPFFQYVANKIDNFSPPFFISVFNLTSHHPYIIPQNYIHKMPVGHTKLQKCVAYTDLSFRYFFDRIKDKPWFSNTIFVFVADHVSPEKYAPETKTPKGSTSIFYFIYSPNKIIQGLDSQVTQQLDVMPTILGLVGYKKPYFAFGRDVFNELERVSMSTTYINGVYQCITDSISIYFNEKQIISAYAPNDVFQKKNLVKQNAPAQQKAEIQLKALLQSYYFHLYKKNYVVPSK